MKNELYRKEAVERITSPEDLNTYVRVLNPRIWLVLLGIAVAVAGGVVFVALTGYPIRDLIFGIPGSGG